jgi:bifunctional non-homologous end joining protein LigD
VTWAEVELALKKKDATLLVFESRQVLERVGKMGDLFAPVLALKQKLPKLGGIGEGRAEAIATGLEMAAHAEKPARAKPTKPERSTNTRNRRQKV